MRPVLFNILGTQVYSYYAFISLGILIGLYFFYRYSKRSNINTQQMLDISMISIISGYIGARLFHVLFSMPEFYLKNPEQILYFWNGGYAIYGAIIVPIIFIYIYAKNKKMRLLSITDALAPSLSIGTAVGRIGCLMQGCCYGKETSIIWAIKNSSGHLVHPTQIYLSLHGLIMFLLLAYCFNKKRYTGQLTYLYFALYSSGRFIIEIFRADERGGSLGLSSFQIISLLLLAWSIHKLVSKRKVVQDV